EFYLMCGEPVPAADLYDGYPQIEDGIGITRHFLENLQTYLGRSKAGSLAGVSATIACGTLIGPTMHSAIDDLNRHLGASVDVRVLENSFFGPEINISGLLTGKDLIAGFANDPARTPVYISSRMISDRTQTLLDDLTVEQVQAELGRPVVPCLTLSDVARDLRHRHRTAQAA
ncbi:MAG TPA: DUF512 domain-containing protein, partial [Thermomicrobiales bacterium]|nr:DUF512 domain-containing protein [Thermomicrobiales bacterium]